MADPAQALAIKVREELDITEPAVTPLRDGLVTGAVYGSSAPSSRSCRSW